MQKLWAFVSGADGADADPSLGPGEGEGGSDSGSVVINTDASSDSKLSPSASATEASDKEYLQFQIDLKRLDSSVEVLRRFAGEGLAGVLAGDLADAARETAASEGVDSAAEIPPSADNDFLDEYARDQGLRESGSRVLVHSSVKGEGSDSSSCASEGADTGLGHDRQAAKLKALPPTNPVDAVEDSELDTPGGDADERREENAGVNGEQVVADVEAGTVENAAASSEAGAVQAPIPPTQRVVAAFSGLAEVMVRGDRVSHALWDRFMEHSTMKLILECLDRTSASNQGNEEGSSSLPASSPNPDAGASLSTENSTEMLPVQSVAGPELQKKDAVCVQAQVLRTLSILVHSVNRRESLYCLFASNHINMLLSFPFDFSDDEVLLYFMSAVKTIGLSLDDSLVQLFFDARAGTFPLYTATTRFFAHSDGMVRIAVRNVSLTIFTLTNPTVTDFTVRDPTGYLTGTVDRLGRLCGEIARAFEFLLDDGREHRRAVSRRTLGRMRQKLRLPQLQAQLSEVDNVIEYLNDVVACDNPLLREHITDLLATRFLGPFFRPIASQASPDAVLLSKERWGFRAKSQKSALNCEPAISVFDAAARSVVLSYLVNLVTNQQLGDVILSEITKPSSRFQMRTAVHGLRAMASDLSGKERTTLIAFTALEAIIRWDCVSAERMAAHGLTFELAGDDAEVDSLRRTTSAEVAERFSRLPSAPNPSPDGDVDASSLRRDGMVLSLGEFKAPLTPIGINSPVSGLCEVDEPDTPTSPPSPNLPDAIDDEGILALFGRGEASLREIVSAIILVVRTHEVRTVRLTRTVARVISGVGLHAQNWRLSLDVAKIALDELASNMTDFLASSHTTIVAIESCFDNFQAASLETSEACATVPELWTLLQLDRVVRLASELPHGANGRRSVTPGGSISPIQWEDAATFFILLRAYERVLTEVIIEQGGNFEPSGGKGRSLYSVVANILQDEDSAGTYIDKKEALARVAHHTLKYSWRVAIAP